jgi:alpha-mannosidase
MAEATKDFPDEAKFRIVVEQIWSVDHFLRNTTEAKGARMIDLMREGRVEITVLFGNMITEICGHEVLARSLYHAFRLKRKFGIPIVWRNVTILLGSVGDSVRR